MDLVFSSLNRAVLGARVNNLLALQKGTQGVGSLYTTFTLCEIIQVPSDVPQAESATCITKLVRHRGFTAEGLARIRWAGERARGEGGGGLRPQSGHWERGSHRGLQGRASRGGGGAGEPARWAWGVHLYVTLEFAASRE